MRVLGLDSQELPLQWKARTRELSSPRVLRCPTDRRPSATTWDGLASTNISFFLALGVSDPGPQTRLAGDRNLTTNGVPVAAGLFCLTEPVHLGWSLSEMHRGRGNSVFADGSVQARAEWILAPPADGPALRFLVP